MPPTRLPPLPVGQAFLYGVGAIGCFHAAYLVPALGPLVFLYVVCLAQFVRLSGPSQARVAGLLTALGCVAPQLAFFYGIFGSAAWALWAILAAWLAVFVGLVHAAWRQLPVWGAALLTPFLWTGLEYFRSELYPLRFSWLNVGYALGPIAWVTPFRFLGGYGMGFLAAALAAWILAGRPKPWATLAIITAIFLMAWLPLRMVQPIRELQVAGVQLEIPSTQAVLENLDRLAKDARLLDTPLYVLSEYTFDGPVPEKIRDWCRQHGKYLIVGGVEKLPGGRTYNTAFVVGPTGGIVFQQAKSVPIQFFQDGLPAPDQRLWASPWGKIGICICYDLSYRRVTDRLIRQGAQALIVPTMDAESWGQREHELHTRVAPVRAAEYGVPIFRLASSGISQAVNARGRETARAPFPGDAAVISARLRLAAPGRLPWDRFLVWPSVAATLGFCLYLGGVGLRSLRRGKA